MLAALRATGARRDELFCLCGLADAYRKEGQVERGLRVLTEASTLAVEENINTWCEPELHRLKGELLLNPAVGVAQDGEPHFRRAIEIARTGQMKSLELRAVTSLSRFLGRRGKPEEARQMLAEIYGWFREGFDTTDLKEAKILLDEL